MTLPQRELPWHQQLFGHRFSPFGAAGSIACVSDWSKDEARTEPSIPLSRSSTGHKARSGNLGTVARLLRSHRRRRTVQRVVVLGGDVHGLPLTRSRRAAPRLQFQRLA